MVGKQHRVILLDLDCGSSDEVIRTLAGRFVEAGDWGAGPLLPFHRRQEAVIHLPGVPGLLDAPLNAIGLITGMGEEEFVEQAIEIFKRAGK